MKPASSAGWADELQNLMMPVSLYSDGLTLYMSRGWGDLPQQLRRVDEKEETLWIVLGPPGCAQVSPYLSPGLLDFLVV